jgi:tetratricopeptide (TPR) repeat protein
MLFQSAQHRYAFERELGGGGMATVYLARDLETGARVAIKVLRLEIAPVLGTERFLREIQITTRLTHHNILPVLDSGLVNDLPFYVTPYVAGETLADRLKRESQLPVDEAVTIACQVTEALGAAHSQGFVHRDIKPSNILLAQDGDHVILADFGLARAVDVIGPDQLTQSGLVLGTPAYMSPEQSTSAGRVDVRSDIYSLGCVIYEMLAGSPPFAASTTQSLLARHAVDPVPSLRTVRRTVSPALEAAVLKALAKVPADRYASAAELRAALLSRAPPKSAGARRGAAALGLLGLVAAAIWINPRPAATPAASATRRERLLIADFAGPSGDSSLGSVVSEALRIDFAQSHMVRVVPSPQIADVLVRMRLPLTTRLTPALAREVALREGIKAVVTGEIAAAGPQYVISASLVAAGTGEVITGSRETARDSSQIIGAIDRLSEFLRGRVGESLASVREEPALSRAATGSLVALRKFTQANRAFYLDGSAPKARELYEEAIQIDSSFGMAYVQLTNLLMHVYEHQMDRIGWALTRAFALRDRLPLRDRYLVEASYHNRVRFDFDKSIATYRALLELYPDDTEALSALGAVCFLARHFAAGEPVLRRFVELDSTSHYDWLTLVDLQLAQGKLEDAKATIAHVDRSFPGNEEVDWWMAEFQTMLGHYDVAEARLNMISTRYPRTLYMREWTDWSLANIAAVQGQVRKAERYLRDGMDTSTEEGNRPRYFEFASTLAAYQLRLQRRPDRAVKELERALTVFPFDSLAPLERPYLVLAELMAQSGRPRRARELLAEYERHVDPTYRRMAEGDKHTRHTAQGELALAEGRVADAIAEFREWSERGQCLGCGLTALARAYTRAGLPDSAVAAYERYVGRMWTERIMEDADQLAPAYRELGKLYALRGDTANARRSYERLLELWKNSDLELRPQVLEVRRRLGALNRRT